VCQWPTPISKNILVRNDMASELGSSLVRIKVQPNVKHSLLSAKWRLLKFGTLKEDDNNESQWRRDPTEQEFCRDCELE